MSMFDIPDTGDMRIWELEIEVRNLRVQNAAIQQENEKLKAKIEELKLENEKRKSQYKMYDTVYYLEVASRLLKHCKDDHPDCSWNWYCGISRQIDLSKEFYSEVKKENEALKAKINQLENAKLNTEKAINFTGSYVAELQEKSSRDEEAVKELQRKNNQLKYDLEQSQQYRIPNTQEWNELRDENKKLKAEVEELEMSIGINCRRCAVEKEKLNNQISDLQTYGIALAGGVEVGPTGFSYVSAGRERLSDRLRDKKAKFKVGDRVIFRLHDSTAIKGTVERVKYESLRIKTDNKELDMAIVLTKLCKRLARKQPEFKVGDRVSYDSWKGTVRSVGGDTISINADCGSILLCIDINACKKLVRKKPEFKIGDRVKTTPGKGIIIGMIRISNSSHSFDDNYVRVRLDDGNFAESHIKLIKKLVHKRPVFNVGDRVKGVLSNGTVTATINDRTKVVQVKFDYGETLIVSQESIRKLKRKAKKCRECIDGKLIISAVHGRYHYQAKQIDCPKCKGTGWFHWNNDIP